MAYGGGFRIKIVGERGGDPTNTGRFSSPSDAREKILDEALRGEAESLLTALREATPVYQPHENEEYHDRGLKEGWKIGSRHQTSATGVSIDILNTARAPHLERVSLLSLVSETGAQPHRIPLFGETLLAFPWRRAHTPRPGKNDAMTGDTVFATHVKHPGFRALDFTKRVVDKITTKAIMDRLNRVGAGRTIVALMEHGSFVRSNPSLTRDEIKEFGRGNPDFLEGGFQL